MVADGRIDMYASERQYVEHLAPIWKAMPPERRGAFYTRPTKGAHEQAERERVEHVTLLRKDPIPAEHRPTVVASYGDYLAVDRPELVYVEHGAGQRYGPLPDPNHYAGGPDRGRVALFLVPSERVAEINRTYHPSIPVAVVGCPKLDPWHAGDRGHTWPPAGEPRRPVVAISFHWDFPGYPEGRNAWRYYRHGLRALVKAHPGRVLGHAHPRQLGICAPTYRSLGIEVVAQFSDVLDRADVYACDNSSTLFEFASTTRPVVFLNAPWYRREVEHGLRFWSHVRLGVQVDHPTDLVAGVARALDGPACTVDEYRELIGQVYAWRDGQASARAAAAICDRWPTGG